MVTTRTSAIVLLIAALLSGCANHPAAPTHIELTGTPSAPVTGYYILDGRRVELNTTLPTTLPAHGVSQFAVRKTNPRDELHVKIQGPEGSLTHEPKDGVRIQIAGGLNVSVLSPDDSLSPPNNSLMVINPYWSDGTWVFDDARTGLVREPFVAGVPEVINHLVRDIPNARAGFRLTFSAKPFPTSQMKLTWVRAESGGNVYRLASPPMEGWLCPAMFRYFDKAPKHLYVRADPKGT